MSDDWFYAPGNVRKGPVARAKIEELIETGAIKPDTLIWGDGMVDWAPASEAFGASRGRATLRDSAIPVVLAEPDGARRTAEDDLELVQFDDAPVPTEAVAQSPWAKDTTTASPWKGATQGKGVRWTKGTFGEATEVATKPAHEPKRPTPTFPQSVKVGPPSWPKAVAHAFSNMFNFQGRDVRWQFWYFFAFAWIVSSFGSNILSGFLTPRFGADVGSLSLISFALILPLVASAVRRFHDIGASGYYTFLLLIPGLGWLFAAFLLARGSDAQANAYGPAPVQV